jgi:hypothetical protein
MLSFSIFTFYGQRALEQWNAPDPSPTAALVEGFSEDVSGLWASAKQMGDSAVAFYRLQTGAVVVEESETERSGGER